MQYKKQLQHGYPRNLTTFRDILSLLGGTQRTPETLRQPGWVHTSRECPNSTSEIYNYTLLVSIFISGIELGHSLEVWAHPGWRKASGSPLRSAQKRKCISKCCKVSGVSILQWIFILHNERETATHLVVSSLAK